MASETVAFVPTNAPKAVVLTAVYAPKGKVVDSPELRRLLGQRLQRLVDRAPDPQAAADQLADDLDSLDLWRSGRVPASRAGQDLVADNQLLGDRLDLLQVNPPEPDGQVATSSPQATSQLLREQTDPMAALRQWAGSLKP